MRRRGLMGLACGAAMALSATGQAAAPQKETFRFKGMGASAFLSEGDDCVSTRLDVTAFDRVQRTNGTSTPTERLISVYFNSYDTCTGAFVAGSVDSMPEADFAASMQGASLKLTFLVHVGDGTGPAQEATAALTVSWTPTGDLFKSASQTLSRMGDTVVRTKSDGTTRNANVVGTVKVAGGQTFQLDGPGEISNNTFGSIQIIR
jgi:hypothetical protein